MWYNHVNNDQNLNDYNILWYPWHEEISLLWEQREELLSISMAFLRMCLVTVFYETSHWIGHAVPEINFSFVLISFYYTFL